MFQQILKEEKLKKIYTNEISNYLIDIQINFLIQLC